MNENRIGIIMNGVTGRMGTNQLLMRSIVEIIKQGGVKLSEQETIIPDPVTIFREIESLSKLETASYSVEKIITADPHAYNALKKDYADLPPVEHISQTIIKSVNSGNIRFKPAQDSEKRYVYHDPCYLGRHNSLYEDPRDALDAIPGLNRIEMEGDCRDRSFCCGGGGLMLFYEPEEEQRMGVLRVQMAKEAGANVIVTACPFCLVNIEDAIKVAGLEGEMAAIDLCELIAAHLVEE